MTDFIPLKEEQEVRQLRASGYLEDFTRGEMRLWTPGGGVDVGCSDDTIDAFHYNRSAIPEMRPIRHFGLPLILIPSFEGYDPEFGPGCIRFMIKGMKHKKTGSVRNVFHHPCGIGEEYGMTLEKIIFWAAPELLKVYMQYEFFNPAKIFMLLHLKRRKGQKTYRINLSA